MHKYHTCLNCCGDEFCTTVRVVQTWQVNSHGNFIELMANCSEASHSPNKNNIWTCVDCGTETTATPEYAFINSPEEHIYVKVPLTKEQVNARKDEHGKIAGVIKVTLVDMINNDIDDFLDIIEQKLVTDRLLYEIDYRLVGCSSKSVFMLVSAYVEDTN